MTSIAVVIPAYRVARQIVPLIARIPPLVTRIIVVDDACPEHSGALVRQQVSDPRVRLIVHAQNQGVGAAVISGVRAALEGGADIVVKLDGDAQYDPELIPYLVQPIIAGNADVTKGNRFFFLEDVAQMPALRLFGNAVLSFVNKAVSGYWDVMDPTNGFIAIHAEVLHMLPLDKLAPRYFFESDLLFRLGTLRAVVQDMPVRAHYADEHSSLRIGATALGFPLKYASRLFKRIFYNHFLRDFNLGSVSLVVGLLLLGSGGIFGALEWYRSYATGHPATAGTVMLVALQLIVSLNLLILFLTVDIGNVPRRVLHRSVLRQSGRRNP